MTKPCSAGAWRPAATPDREREDAPQRAGGTPQTDGARVLGARLSGAFPALQAASVAAGAAVGALLRWRAAIWLNASWPGFPLGTLLVNCVGGLLIGASIAWFEQWPSDLLRLLLVTGLLGGLTTFSAFSAESLVLLERGQWLMAAGHTLAHVLGALACAAAGVVATRALIG